RGFSCGWVTTNGPNGRMLSPGAWPSTELLPSWQPPPAEQAYCNPLVSLERGCEITVRETAFPVATTKPTNSWFVTTRFQILLFSPVTTPTSQLRTMLDLINPPCPRTIPIPVVLEGRQSCTRTSLILLLGPAPMPRAHQLVTIPSIATCPTSSLFVMT